jgi:hypothetical protein
MGGRCLLRRLGLLPLRGAATQVRRWSQSFIKPGIVLADMCEALENKNRELMVEAGLARGIGFPTGCSLNHVAAHYTPNGGDRTTLSAGDVMKVDFGTQINGGWAGVFRGRSRGNTFELSSPRHWSIAPNICLCSLI